MNKVLLIIGSTLKILFILLWTAVCGVAGMLLMLITWNGRWVHLVDGKYLWSPLVCLISGVRVTVHGIEKIDPKAARIYVANHASHFDIVALSRVMPIGLFFIAKKELSRVPVLGQYMWLIGHIFVNRGNKDEAKKSMRIAAEKIKSGRNVISFPEGTRTKTKVMGLFKRGSFIIAKEGNIDIVPIAIKGSQKVLKSGSYILRSGHIHVYIGDLIRTQALQSLSPDELATLARNSVNDMMKKDNA